MAQCLSLASLVILLALFIPPMAGLSKLSKTELKPLLVRSEVDLSSDKATREETPFQESRQISNQLKKERLNHLFKSTTHTTLHGGNEPNINKASYGSPNKKLNKPSNLKPSSVLFFVQSIFDEAANGSGRPIVKQSDSETKSTILGSHTSLPAGIVHNLPAFSSAETTNSELTRNSHTASESFPYEPPKFKKDIEVKYRGDPNDPNDYKTKASKPGNGMHEEKFWGLLTYLKLLISQFGLLRFQRHGANRLRPGLPVSAECASVRNHGTRSHDKSGGNGAFPLAGLEGHVDKKPPQTLSATLAALGLSLPQGHTLTLSDKKQLILKLICSQWPGAKCAGFSSKTDSTKTQNFPEHKHGVKEPLAHQGLRGSSKLHGRSKDVEYRISLGTIRKLSPKMKGPNDQWYTFSRLLDSQIVLRSNILQNQMMKKKARENLKCQVLQGVRQRFRCFKNVALKILEEYLKRILRFLPSNLKALSPPKAKRIKLVKNREDQPAEVMAVRPESLLEIAQQRSKRDALVAKQKFSHFETYILANETGEDLINEVNKTVSISISTLSDDESPSHVLTSSNSESSSQTKQKEDRIKHQLLDKDSSEFIPPLTNGSLEMNSAKVQTLKNTTPSSTVKTPASIVSAIPAVNESVIRPDKGQVCLSHSGTVAFLACRSREMLRTVTGLFDPVKNVLKRPALQLKDFLSSQYTKAQQIYQWICQRLVFPTLQSWAQNLFPPTLSGPSPQAASKTGRAAKDNKSHPSLMLTQETNKPALDVKVNATHFVPNTGQRRMLSVDSLELDSRSSGLDQEVGFSREKVIGRDKGKDKTGLKRKTKKEKIHRTLGDIIQPLKEEQKSISSNDRGQLVHKSKSLKRGHAKKGNFEELFGNSKNSYAVRPISLRSAKHHSDVFPEQSDPRKSLHSVIKRPSKRVVFRRSPHRVDKNRSDKVVLKRRPQDLGDSEAKSMAEKLVDLMSRVKHSHKSKASYQSAIKHGTTVAKHKDVPTKGDMKYGLNSIGQDEPQDDEDIGLDFSTDRKPTEADRNLLSNIESLTYLVLGHTSRPGHIDKDATPEPDSGGSVSSKDDHVKRLDKQHVTEKGDKIKTLPDSNAYADMTRAKHLVDLADTSQEENGGDEILVNGGKKEAKKLNHKYKKNHLEQPGRLGHHYRGKNNKHLSRQPKGLKHRGKHGNKPRLERSYSGSDGQYKDVNNEISPHASGRIAPQRPRKFATSNTRPVGKVVKSEVKTRTRRSLSTIDLMDDFRIHWPSLRKKATTLRDKIVKLKNSYDSAVDDLNRLLRMGEDYNEDAKNVALRDRQATEVLNSETEKMKTAEANFQKFQREIAVEEDQALNYMKNIEGEAAGEDAQESYKSFPGLLDEASTVPENNVGLEMADTTLETGGPGMRAPLSGDQFQGFPLESMIEEPETDKSKTEDVNLHMIEGELSEIVSQKDMNVKSSERRKRSIETEGRKNDVNHVIVGFHPVNFEGDAEDAETEGDDHDDDDNEEDDGSDDELVAGVDDDDDDSEDDSGVEVDGNYEESEDDNDDDDGNIDEDDELPEVAADDIAQSHQEIGDVAHAHAEDLEREHALKMWDDVGTDIEMYAAPDRVTPNDFREFTDSVEEAEHQGIDNIASGKDLVNDLQAEVLTPKKDSVIEGLVAPGARQIEKETRAEARLMDTIPSLDTIEDISGVLKAAGRDYKQELKLRDMGVDVDKFLEPGDLDPYDELIDEGETSDVLNKKYISFFSSSGMGGSSVQKQLRDIVKTRQQADAAFNSLRATESMVDESVNPGATQTALDEQLQQSIESLRRAQQKQKLQGEMFAQEDQRQEAAAIRQLELNNQALIDQRMRQAHSLEEDLKAAAADQVEVASRQAKLLQDLDKQTRG